MSEPQKEIDVYQSARFEKAMKKLPESDVKIIEDEIDQIIDNPLIGEQKKGDLTHLRVHKFRLNELTVLLGYSWVANKVELYLLHIGSHENFYNAQKKQRKTDLKLITT
ncbi:type II toxin-antitoxin system RelE/ParE family toxin [Proteus sp. WDL240414]|uniref:Type II toxin-antitoxin system RelE/ParE family toxin n=2 Tax=Proteus TaxID=583 RepID=A0A6I7D1F1_9GAMM|nr:MULTISPECIES: type II toxin-antitoxin system RelE/ParE family toxin [Proteus]MBG2803825.1 type II toxin-antitoxin system RelE/ParE family toxin [Proteus mirabilis]MBG3018499.1 type II toxin-antitoxin system RelE/ParE family toxin [Proteus mirabilis]MBG3150772.1 type II toxin-antitoxin system RelE/ParE family toxin [Proteus mirabilis]QHN09529.1 type II toxin-antitoxin system RelE/ParE family toxin [Proteus columbae]